MACFKGFWHGKWAGAAAGALALLTLACSGSGDSSSVTVSGHVSYTRQALSKDSNGVPTALADYGSPQSARGVRVRAIEAKAESSTAYVVASTTYTDEYGNYSLSVEKGVPAFIEVQSISGPSTCNSIRLVADEDASPSTTSTLAVDNLKLYALRKSLDGSTASTATPTASASQGNVTVNFAVDENTSWWHEASPVSTTGTNLTNATLDTTPTGSRVLGILDSVYTFTDVYGDPTPGGTVDLFYRPSLTSDTKSYINFSTTQYSTTEGKKHYLGALRANPIDDAWHESIIFMLCARNALYSHTTVTPYTPPSDQLPMDTAGLALKTGLDPIHALIDGMPYGMAASLLRSPYLSYTNSSSAFDYLNLTGLTSLEMDAYSAPGIAALSWDLLLRANPSATSASTWSKIDTEGLRRFFTLKIPVDSSSRPTDTASIYKQLLRLTEDPSSDDTVDLNNYFMNSTLPAIVKPYGIAWPRPISGSDASFLLDWGTDPNTDSTDPFTLQMDMSSAHADSDGIYPNLSKGEIVHAKFLLSKDTLYTLAVTPSTALPSGVTLEVQVLETTDHYTFDVTGSGGTVTDSLMLDGDGTTPKYIPFHFRLKTDSTITAPISPVTITVTLVPKAS